MLQKCFLSFAFLKLSKLEIFFQKQNFYIWIKGKNRPGNPNGENHEKSALKRGEAWLKPGDFT